MRTYLHTRVVRASPAKNVMGKPGYRVVSGTDVYFVAEEEFEREYRTLNRREDTLLKLTGGELGIMSITDEDYELAPDPVDPDID